MDRRALKFMQKRYFLFGFILVFSSHLIWKTCTYLWVHMDMYACAPTYVYVCQCTPVYYCFITNVITFSARSLFCTLSFPHFYICYYYTPNRLSVWPSHSNAQNTYSCVVHTL